MPCLCLNTNKQYFHSSIFESHTYSTVCTADFRKPIRHYCDSKYTYKNRTRTSEKGEDCAKKSSNSNNPVNQCRNLR